MREISRFLGITVWICEDFEASGHIHINYNQYQCVMGIENCAIFNGSLPPRIAALVCEWIIINKTVLAQCWELHKSGNQNLPTVRPLVE